MPAKTMKPCAHPSCSVLVQGTTYCKEHEKAATRRREARRESSSERGYDSRWRKESTAFLRAHPLCACVDCQSGKIRATPASVVDHKVPHRGDMKLFWDQSNWQPMAKACHDRKTVMEDGGFGNAVRA